MYLDGRGARNPQEQAFNTCQQQCKGSGAVNDKPFASPLTSWSLREGRHLLRASLAKGAIHVGQILESWLKEYLPTLQLRQKRCNPCHRFAVNKLILVMDGSAHRGKWPLAQVVQVHRGRDGYNLQMPQHSLDLFQNCAFLCMMNSKSVMNWINYSENLLSENYENTQI